MPSGRRHPAISSERIRSGRKNLRNCFRLRRRTISLRRLRRQRRTWRAKDYGPPDLRRCRIRQTEVAIRAAFKAVQESKQVVYLVPTTILAQQHYNTFVERMKDFPVRVDLLCRFRTPAEQKKTLEDLKKGLVDIVIGTHRVLSRM